MFGGAIGYWPSDKSAAVNFTKIDLRRFKIMIWSRRRSAWRGFQPRISFDGSFAVLGHRLLAVG